MTPAEMRDEVCRLFRDAAALRESGRRAEAAVAATRGSDALARAIEEADRRLRAARGYLRAVRPTTA